MILRNAGKLLTIFFFFMLVSFHAFSQGKPDSYKIVSNGTVQDVKPYKDALNAADMDKYRLRDKRVTIVFETGVKVELFSASELIAMGYNVTITDFEAERAAGQQITFALAANNYILELHTPTGKY
jgi:hypothetical protein